MLRLSPYTVNRWWLWRDISVHVFELGRKARRNELKVYERAKIMISSYKRWSGAGAFSKCFILFKPIVCVCVCFNLCAIL